MQSIAVFRTGRSNHPGLEGVGMVAGGDDGLPGTDAVGVILEIQGDRAIGHGGQLSAMLPGIDPGAVIQGGCQWHRKYTWASLSH